MGWICKLAALIGTDPVTFVVLGAMSGLCAHFMCRVSPQAWSWLVFWPALMAGGLLTDDAAVALGLYEVADVSMSADWDFAAIWSAMSDSLPNVLLAATAGMSATGLALLAIMRKLEEWN